MRTELVLAWPQNCPPNCSTTLALDRVIQALVGGTDLCDEIPQVSFLWKRLQDHLSWLKAGGAGILDPAVDNDQAFLTGVCIDAGMSDAQRGIEVRANEA
jgi:hypothetical protein